MKHASNLHDMQLSMSMESGLRGVCEALQSDRCVFVLGTVGSSSRHNNKLHPRVPHPWEVWVPMRCLSGERFHDLAFHTIAANITAFYCADQSSYRIRLWRGGGPDLGAR